MRSSGCVAMRFTSMWVVAIVSLATGCKQLETAIKGYSAPEWNAVAKSSDGRQFVTDGRLALVVDLAQPKELPSETSPAWFDSALRSHSVAEKQELFTRQDVKASADDPNVVIAPGGIVLDKNHVNYVAGEVSGRLSFWQFSRMEPIVIVVDGKAAGAMKVISQP